MKTSESTIFF